MNHLAGSRQQAAGSRQQAAGSRQQAAGSRQQAADSQDVAVKQHKITSSPDVGGGCSFFEPVFDMRRWAGAPLMILGDSYTLSLGSG
jgi:hypothetical protein